MFCNNLCTFAAIPTVKDGNKEKTASKKASSKDTPRKAGKKKPTSKKVVQKSITPKKKAVQEGATPKVGLKKVTPKKRGPKGGTPRKNVTPRRSAPATNKARGKVQCIIHFILYGGKFS